MTRRMEVEAMLARYGSETVSGGETFSAFIRPMRFQSESTGGARFSYVGPAAHKLSVGGTVTSGDADYTVKRCETVLLSGEELFVRAVLAPLSGPSVTSVSIERDGKTIARAESCVAEVVCGADAVVPWGESIPAEIADGAVKWKLMLTGLNAEAGADLFSPGEFNVSVERKDSKTVYSGCRWTLIRKAEGTADGSFTMEALATERGEKANKNG